MMNNPRENDFFEELTKRGIQISDEQKRRIQAKINSVLTYKPRIGVFGASGVGKSSLCNALFGQEICRISDIEACTRKPQEVLINMGSNGLNLIDMPGLNESSRRDKEYAKLYSKLLPELDLVLWLLKADDRAFASDEFFYKNIVKPHMNVGKPLFFVLNQIDKIEPSHEWNSENHIPGIMQLDNIHKKVKAVSSYFSISASKIIAVSAKEHYNLSKLIDEIVSSLPREKKITFLRGVSEANRSANSVTAVNRAWYEVVIDFLTSVIEIGKEIVFKVLDKSGNAFENFFEWIFRLF